MSKESTPDISTITDIANLVSTVTQAAIAVYKDKTGNLTTKRDADISRLSLELGFELLRVFEADTVLDPFPISLPIRISWFAEGYDFANAVKEALSRDKRQWLVDDNPGLLNDYLLPALYQKGLLSDD